jgi:hypothetical protein
MTRQFILRDPQHGKAMVDYVKAHAGAQAAAGAPLVVSIDTYKAKRSGEQNRLLHALLNDIAEQATVNGKYFSAETWKELVRRKFIGCEEIDLPDGSRLERGVSTTALSVGEFTQLIDKVQAWAVTELGVQFQL